MAESNIVNPLKNTFKEFLKTAESIRSKSVPDNLIGIDDSVNEDLALIKEDLVLNTMVDDIENDKIFIKLIEETKRFFKGNDTFKGKSFTAEKYVKNFFRNTSFYTNIYNNMKINDDAWFNDYSEAFSGKKKYEIDYLIPIESFSFFNNLMKFKGFNIQKFSKDDLKNILFKNDINRTFYKDSFVEDKYFDILKNYWMIHIKREVWEDKFDFSLPSKFDEAFEYEKSLDERKKIVEENKADKDSIVADILSYQEKYYDGKSRRCKWIIPSLEPVILSLLLYNYEKICGDFLDVDADMCINQYPVIITNHNNPLHCPETIGKGINYFQKEDIESEDIGFHKFSKKDTSSFESKLKNIVKIVDNLYQDDFKHKFSPFISVAVTHFLKGHFTDIAFEKITNYFIVIESLLQGEDEHTKKFSKRLKTIYKKFKEVKESDDFDKVRKFRNCIVHGSSIEDFFNELNEKVDDEKKENSKTLLQKAHLIARSVILWTALLLDHWTNNQRTENQIPPTMIDANLIHFIIDNHDNINKYKLIFGKMPKDLPKWDDEAAL